jgi:hypothetical protein
MADWENFHKYIHDESWKSCTINFFKYKETLIYHSWMYQFPASTIQFMQYLNIPLILYNFPISTVQFQDPDKNYESSFHCITLIVNEV